MPSELSSIFLNKCFEARTPLSNDDPDHDLVLTIRKIGFIAACIDLESWRQVIDQVVCEVQAANEKPNLPELQVSPPLTVTSTPAISRAGVIPPPRLVQPETRTATAH